MKKLEETNINSVLVVVLLILQIALTSVQIIKLNQYVALTLGAQRHHEPRYRVCEAIP